MHDGTILRRLVIWLAQFLYVLVLGQCWTFLIVVPATVTPSKQFLDILYCLSHQFSFKASSVPQSVPNSPSLSMGTSTSTDCITSRSNSISCLNFFFSPLMSFSSCTVSKKRASPVVGPALGCS